MVTFGPAAFAPALRCTPRMALSLVDGPEGVVPEPKGSEPPYEITEWTTMSDLKALTFSIWTSDNRAIRVLDLNKVDLDGSEIQLFALDQPQTAIDLS